MKDLNKLSLCVLTGKMIHYIDLSKKIYHLTNICHLTLKTDIY